MSDMADLLAWHRLGHTVGYAVHCACDPAIGYSPDRFYAHQAAVLSAAGFGLVREAGAAAWDEGSNSGYLWALKEGPWQEPGEIAPANPYRNEKP